MFNLGDQVCGLTHTHEQSLYTIFIWVLLTSALRGMVKKSINRNYVLEMQTFTFVLAMITQLIAKLLILVF